MPQRPRLIKLYIQLRCMEGTDADRERRKTVFYKIKQLYLKGSYVPFTHLNIDDEALRFPEFGSLRSSIVATAQPTTKAKRGLLEAVQVVWDAKMAYDGILDGIRQFTVEESSYGTSPSRVLRRDDAQNPTATRCDRNLPSLTPEHGVPAESRQQEIPQANRNVPPLSVENPRV